MTSSTEVDLIWAEGEDINRSSQPVRHQHGLEVQPFGTLRLLPIALSYEARLESCRLLNHILADGLILASRAGQPGRVLPDLVEKALPVKIPPPQSTPRRHTRNATEQLL